MANRKSVKVETEFSRMSLFRQVNRELRASYVLVGIPEGKAERKGSEIKGGISNAEIGYLSEFGSANGHIPQRPFLAPGIERVRADIIKDLTPGNVLDGDCETRLERAGLRAMVSVKNYIKNQEGFKPLAPATLRARERAHALKGTPAGEKALIDTGSFINSISYVVERGGERGKSGS